VTDTDQDRVSGWMRTHIRPIVAFVLLAVALAGGVLVGCFAAGGRRVVVGAFVVLVLAIIAAEVGGWGHKMAAAIGIGVLVLVFLSFGVRHLGPVGTRHWRPTAAELTADASPRFDLAFGQGAIDLSALGCRKKQESVRIASRVGAGNLTVTVPAQAEVKGDIQVDLGRIQIFGSTDSGTSLDRRGMDKRPAKVCANPQGRSAKGPSSRTPRRKSRGPKGRKPPVVRLALSTGFGVVVVRRSG
jgi:hypothetical protein